jgi:hypothetical protein
MSRTFRRDESGRKSLDTRRAKKREKANSHYTDTVNPDKYDRMKLAQEARWNFVPGYGLDTDED